MWDISILFIIVFSRVLCMLSTSFQLLFTQSRVFVMKQDNHMTKGLCCLDSSFISDQPDVTSPDFFISFENLNTLCSAMRLNLRRARENERALRKTLVSETLGMLSTGGKSWQAPQICEGRKCNVSGLPEYPMRCFHVCVIHSDLSVIKCRSEGIIAHQSNVLFNGKRQGEIIVHHVSESNFSKVQQFC